MIDSHCHLDHEPLFKNIKKVINNSKKIGVEKILTISTTNNSYKNVKKIVKLDPIIFGSKRLISSAQVSIILTFSSYSFLNIFCDFGFERYEHLLS